MSTNTFTSWTPAVLAKHPDNIVSSEFTTAKRFKPSYEKDEPCMEQLMSNEYQRMWLTERNEWLRKTTSPSEKKKRQAKGVNDDNKSANPTRPNKS